MRLFINVILKKIKLVSIFLFFQIMFYSFTIYGQGLIVDHYVIEKFDQIPAKWIIDAKNKFKFHYQHTSHGSQPIRGIERIETELYKISREEEALPNIPNTLNIYEDIYPVQSRYYNSSNIPALDNNPSINISMWSWCTEMNRKEQDNLQRYFDGMENLEAKYPNVTFIYITGNAQSWHGHHTYNSDSEGYNRYLNNEIIREYCRENNKILFDFGEMDCWYGNDKATSEYNGNIFPREHDEYNIDEGGHTSFINCERKAKAFWYMMAVLAGWDQKTSPINIPKNKDSKIIKQYKLQNYPNPFNAVTIINYCLPISGFITIQVFNTSGKEIATLEQGYKNAGNHNIVFDANNIPTGLYIYKIITNNYCKTKKMLLIK